MDPIQFAQLYTAIMTQNVVLSRLILGDRPERLADDQTALQYVFDLYRFVASRVDVK
ncbi:MAG: hypothetical protein HY574_09510 [candidate division NC10 bacterium]|nr:hypothetical protein [candidate division NC10 bacterium]